MGNGAKTAGRVLVVEDDPVSALFVSHVLTKRGGFEVTHTPDPAAALAMVGSQSWDLVLTDVEMPGMTGLELLEAVPQLVPGPPDRGDHRARVGGLRRARAAQSRG